MRHTQCVLVLMLMAASSLFAATRTVAQDGSGDYTVVQQAIDASTTGDTVLVHPGTYYENITINTGITLGSLFLTTGNESYVQQTVLDGNQQATVLAVRNTGQNTCNIVGLTLCNGFDGDYPQAGGLKTEASDVIATKCFIERNRSEGSGGVCAYGGGELLLRGCTIRHNRGSVGGIILRSAILSFDPDYPCNIYMNYGSVMDIFKCCQSIQDTLEVYADTVTVLNPLSCDGYFYDSERSGSGCLNKHSPLFSGVLPC